jgi:hypothetical protein
MKNSSSTRRDTTHPYVAASSAPTQARIPACLRAMAQHEEEVVLYMYDLTHGMAKALSLPLLGRQVEGVWHTAVVVHGTEHYFGAGMQRAAPGRTHFGPPHTKLVLGRTRIGREVLEEYLRGIAPRFTAQCYNILDNNCNNFSNELATFLLGSGIPQDILDLPRLALASPALGPMLAPMLQPLSAALAVSETQPSPGGGNVLSQAGSGGNVPPQGASGDGAAADEAAFERSVKAEFERLLATGVSAADAADQAVTRVLERSGLA